MENLYENDHPEGAVSAKKEKEAFNSDVPADEIEDNRNVGSGSDSNSDDSSSSDSDSDSEFECDICERGFSNYLIFKQHLKGKKHAKTVLKKKKEKKLLKKNKTTESDDEHLIAEPYAECKICKKEFGGPEAYEQHLKCKKHKRKVLQASILEQVQDEGKINADRLRDLCKNKRTVDNVLQAANEKIESLTLEDEEKEGEFECKECEKEFSGLIPYAQHLMSKTHTKTVEKKNLLHKVVPDLSEEDDEFSENIDANTLCIEDDVIVCKVCSTAFSGPENAAQHMKSKNHSKNFEKYVRKLERRKKKKQSKDTTDFNLSKENEIKSEHESGDKTTTDKLHPTADDSGKSEKSNNSQNSTVNSSTLSNQVKEVQVAYEKHEEYKSVMNSAQDDMME